MTAQQVNRGPSCVFHDLACGMDVDCDAAEHELGDAGFAADDQVRVIAIDYGYHDDETLLNAYSAMRLTGNFDNALMCVMQERVMMLVLEREACSSDFCKVLESYLLKRSCKAGISEAVLGVGEIKFACKQARIALEYGSFDGDRRMAYFSDCYVSYLLSGSSLDEPLIAYCLQRSVLREIFDEDRNRGSHLLNYLQAYIENGCRASKAAFLLNVDRDELLSQIERLQKKYGFNLSEPRVRERIRIELNILSRNGMY